MRKPLLLLIDGSSYLFRAYHALPDLRNSRDEPTGAIYGVLNMLRKLHQDYSADYSACVFDAKGKTFRDDWYPEYKATRSAMPDDLSRQTAALHESIRAMGWPLLIIDGVEADDVIGTLALEAKRRGVDTVISTGDKDMAQLVCPEITLVNTMSNETFDEAAVERKFGVPAGRLIDYFALVGDSIDNVPGVDKVGPKTAVKWLTQYGTLDNIIERADEIGGAVGENLRKSLDWLPQARRLLTIRCDVELPVALDALKHQDADRAKLRELFARFEFRTWLRELEAVQNEIGERTSAPQTECRYETILDRTSLLAWINRLQAAARFALDAQTSATDPLSADIIGLSFSTEAYCAAYLPLAHNGPGAPQTLNVETALAELKPLLENIVPTKIGHNLKFLKHVLANRGVTLNGILDDTLLQSYVVESHKPHDVQSMALRHLGTGAAAYTDVVGKGAKQLAFGEIDLAAATQFACQQADLILRLSEHLNGILTADPKLDYVYRSIEIPTLEVLFTMERNGVLLDCDLLNAQTREIAAKLAVLEEHAFGLAGQPFNLGSPQQIQDVLFNRLQLPVKKKTASGAPSTDEDVLQQLALDYPLPKLILEHRGLAKLKSTYTDKLPNNRNPRTARVHTCYNQAVAVTGRLASSEPNLQNIPVRSNEGRRIREAFVAPAGCHIVAADYSQIELRIMAHLSQDANLLGAFSSGMDVHRATAAEIFGVDPDQVSADQRRYAKVINFGLIYGMSAFGVATKLEIDRAAAQTYMERYFARYPGVAAYMQRTRESARQNGYVETVFGRRLWLPEIRAGNGLRRQAAERAAINAPMQGTAADLIKLAMVNVQQWLIDSAKDTLLIMQVHDELVLEVPDEELVTVRDTLPDLMCSVAKLDAPLVIDVGVGRNWEAAH